MANTQIESKIRDWLADNLDFVEKGLKLVGKEFHLPDSIGSGGFIDLLCTDIYNNYVIIEIKRSNTSARETINEVFKYCSLIKSNFKAKESEIRIIIISTHWNELIRAYSETYHNSNVTLKGYLIELDYNTNLPCAIRFIDPLPPILINRKFAFWQGLYLFITWEKRTLFIERLKQRLSIAQIEDYVLVNLDAPIANKKIITPYGIAAAFQKQSVPELLHAIKTFNNFDVSGVMERNDFDDDISYQRHLEGAFIDSLAMVQYDDDAEAGYSEKLDGMLNNQGWKIQHINRYGIFKADPRYNDELLIKELRGHDGNNRNKFVGFAESTQLERIREIRQECMNSLYHAPQWAEFIKVVLKDFDKPRDKFRLIIDIYNPDSIINALYLTITKASPDYLPLYRIFVDYMDQPKTEIYIGELNWNQKIPASKLFDSDNYNIIEDEVFRLMIDPDNDSDSKEIGLIYTTKKIIILDNEEIFSGFVTVGDDDQIVLDDTIYLSFQNYVIYNRQKIMKMIVNYNSASITM